MMHDAYAKKYWSIFIFRRIFQSKLWTLQTNMVLFENCKDIAIGSLFKSKNEAKEEVFDKS